MPDDPKFVPSFLLADLNADLTAFELLNNHETPRNSSLLSTENSTSRLPNQSSINGLQLDISSSSIAGGRADLSGFTSDVPSTAKKASAFDRTSFFDEEGGVIFQPDFEFDGEGNIIELPVRQASQQASLNLNMGESDITARVRQEIEEGIHNLQNQVSSTHLNFQDPLYLTTSVL